MPVCCWYSSSTCCDDRGMSILGPPIDDAMDFLANTLKINTQSRCYLYLYGLSCIYCSSTTNQYISLNSTTNEVDVQLCSSVCSRIWEYCHTELKANISDLPLVNVSNSVQICAFVSDWLSEIMKKVGTSVFRFTSSTTNCFTPYNTFIISQSGCVPNYDSVGFGIPVWALPLVAVGVFIICIGVCVCMNSMRKRKTHHHVEDEIEISSAFDPDEESDDDSSLRYYYYSTSHQKRKTVEVIS